VIPSGTTARLMTVWGMGSSDVWAAGESGTILHFTGSGWTPSPSGITDTISHIAGTSSTDLWAVRGPAGLLHYEGSGWTPVDIGMSGPIAGDATSGMWVFGNISFSGPHVMVRR
jgi:hypothetical protein